MNEPIFTKLGTNITQLKATQTQQFYISYDHS